MSFDSMACDDWSSGEDKIGTEGHDASGWKDLSPEELLLRYGAKTNVAQKRREGTDGENRLRIEFRYEPRSEEGSNDSECTKTYPRDWKVEDSEVP